MKVRVNTQFLLDLSVSGFFAAFSMTILTFVIPIGITRSFLVGGSKAVGLVFITLSIIFLISWFFNKNFKFKKKINLPRLSDFILLALPMSPVINYILINSEYINSDGLLYIIGITLAFVLFFSFILPIVFSYFASFDILMISGIALSFTILSMPKILTGYYLLNHFFFTQGMYLIISFIALYLLYLFDKKLTYIMVILFMITGMAFNFLNYYYGANVKNEIQKSDRLVKFLNNKNNKITKKKNIYILVYESYVNLETHNYYGFDNTKHIKFLEELGFKVYHGIYSNAASSRSSTAKILDINAELYPPYDGPKTRFYQHYLSGNSLAPEIFRSNGYKTISLLPHGFFYAPPITWDEHHPKDNSGDFGGGKILVKNIFEGYFRFDAFTDYFNYDDYLKLKKEYLTSSEKNTFFYTHNKWPGHSQNTGRCRPDEKEIHFEGLKKANTEMKNDVLNITKNDPNSIIVLVGDHGPTLTKNCSGLGGFYDANEVDKYDIQDRYGAFLSIYWPKDIAGIEHNIIMSQDIFPSILSRITNNNNLFNQLKAKRELFWDWEINYTIGDINVIDGIIKGGKDDGKPLFNKRSYNLPN